MSYALRFTLTAGGAVGRDAALLRSGRVALHGVPGFVLTPDMGVAPAKHIPSSSVAAAAGRYGESRGAAQLLVELPTPADGTGTALKLMAVTSSDPTLLTPSGTPDRPSPSTLAIQLAVGARSDVRTSLLCPPTPLRCNGRPPPAPQASLCPMPSFHPQHAAGSPP